MLKNVSFLACFSLKFISRIVKALVPILSGYDFIEPTNWTRKVKERIKDFRRSSSSRITVITMIVIVMDVCYNRMDVKLRAEPLFELIFIGLTV